LCITGCVFGDERRRADPAQAQGGAVASSRRFAERVLAASDAVRAAAVLDWSNGPVEDQINR
jgi:transposase